MDFSTSTGSIDDVFIRKHRQLGSSGAQPTPPCPSFTAEETAERIVVILSSYRLVTKTNKNKPWKGRSHVLTQVLKAVQVNSPIRLILPGFPFKSPNKTAKVFGVLPDKAEEVALEHLNGLCASIESTYSAGAYLYIVSDGPMYNDLLGVHDEEVWQYGDSLRQLAMETGCDHVKFIRFAQLLEADDREPWLKESFLKNVSTHRQSLIDKHTPPGFDIDAFIAKDEATTKRYRGCIKFLEKDLELAPWLSDLSKSQRKKAHGKTAKAMLLRGECFAGAVAATFGDYIRLSVHASGTEAVKLSVSMLPQTGEHETTPWHNVLVREVDGSMSMAHKECVQSSSYETIYEHGRASYLRARSQLYDWPDMDVVFEYLYPCGIVIRPAAASSTSSLQVVHMQKVLALAEQCSPIVFRGFTSSIADRAWHSNRSSISDGSLGDSECAKEAESPSESDDDSGNSISRFSPTHEKSTTNDIHDIYKTDDETYGRFQLFNGPAPASNGSIETLFVSSRMFFQLVSSQYSDRELENLAWICRKPVYMDKYTEHHPLVTKHPNDGRLCVSLPESEPVAIAHPPLSSASGRSDERCQNYADLVDTMLNDRRGFTKLGMRTGDVVVNDKFSASHVGTTLRDNGPCAHVCLFGSRTLWYRDTV